MTLAWQRFREKVRETDIKGSFFAPGDAGANIYANPYASAYQCPTPVKRPVKVKVKPQQNPASPIDVKVVENGHECTVCLETKTKDQFRAGKITAECEHDLDVCKDCLVESIDFQFDANIWDHIDCPSCGTRLAAEDVNKFASKSVRNRFVVNYMFNP